MAAATVKDKPGTPETEIEDPNVGQVGEQTDTSTGEISTTTGGPGTDVAIDPSLNYDYGADAGAGFENQTSEDVSVPFLVLLQPGSPEVQGEDAVAKSGQWMNKTTGEIFSGKDGFTFIPVLTQHELVEWIPRDAGGGLVDRHAIDSEIAKRVRSEQPLGTYKHPDMHNDDPNKVNDLVETFMAWGVMINAEGLPTPAVIAFASSHIKPYQDWMFRVRSVVIPLPNGGKLTSRQLPLWALAYQFRSLKKEKNGNTWFVPEIGFAGKDAADSRVPPGSDLYAAAKSVYEGVSGGRLKADNEGLRREERTDGAPSKGDTTAKDAPY